MIDAVVLSIKLGLLTCLILLVICFPLALWLSKTKSKFAAVLEALISLPMILPPIVLGFYLLLFFAPSGWLGNLWLQIFGTPLVFSFTGLVISSVIYSMPFALQPLKQGLAGIPNDLILHSKNLGLNTWQRFWKICLPLIRPSIMIAMILSFAHTLGEFGVVLMIGGNIPKETKVISIELFELVEQLQYQQAHYLAGGLLVFSLMILIPVYGKWGKGHDFS
jgi:molybdate transport system permease protein